MTEKSISALEKQHFARSENMHVYSVWIEDWEPEVFSEDEMDVVVESRYGSVDGFRDVVLRSPLPKDDFKKLAEAKAEDKDFWIKSVLLDKGKVLNDDY